MASSSISKYVKNVIGKLTDSSSLMRKFKNDPIDTVKDLLSDTLSDDTLQAIVTAVKAKLLKDNAEDTADKLKGLLKKLK